MSDHTWRGLVKVPSTDVSGAVSFQFLGSNWQKAGDTEFRENGVTWYPTKNATKLPWRGEVSTSGSAGTYEADGASTYIEFNYNDASGTYSIGHAAYQNFNAWHDAWSDKFVGTFSDTSGVTTATMVQTNANMSAWTPLVTENSNWNEPFYLSNYTDPGYPKGVTFGKHKMPGQWNGDNGMFVSAKLTTSDATQIRLNSGIAWQMQGEEQGDVTFTQSDGPSGLDTLSFQARIGQSIAFDDFSVWYGDGSSSTNINYGGRKDP